MWGTFTSDEEEWGHRVLPERKVPDFQNCPEEQFERRNTQETRSSEVLEMWELQAPPRVCWGCLEKVKTLSEP